MNTVSEHESTVQDSVDHIEHINFRCLTAPLYLNARPQSPTQSSGEVLNIQVGYSKRHIIHKSS